MRITFNEEAIENLTLEEIQRELEVVKSLIKAGEEKLVAGVTVGVNPFLLDILQESLIVLKKIRKALKARKKELKKGF